MGKIGGYANASEIPVAAQEQPVEAPRVEKNTTFIGRTWSAVKEYAPQIAFLVVAALITAAWKASNMEAAVLKERNEQPLKEVQAQLLKVEEAPIAVAPVVEVAKAVDAVQEQALPKSVEAPKVVQADPSPAVVAVAKPVEPKPAIEKPAQPVNQQQAMPPALVARPVLAPASVAEIGGMENGGGTCYMSSVLQALFASPGFFESYIADEDGGCSRKKLESADDFAVRESLYNLYVATRGKATVSGREMNAVRQIHRNSGWRQMRPAAAQEDAQEYCQFLFNKLGVPTFSSYKLLYRNGRDDVAMHQYNETMVHIDLSNPKNASTMRELFNQDVSVIDGVATLCTLRLSEVDAPRTLPIQLKRYKWDPVRGGSKVNNAIALAETLEVPLAYSGGRAARYKLNSCVVHDGVQAESGHYYSYVLQTVNGRKQWVKFDDRRVAVANTNAVEADVKKNGYLFFYELVGIVDSQ